MLRLVLFITVFLATHFILAGGLIECDNSGNLIAAKLEGTWVYDDVISNILGENGQPKLRKIRFKKNSAVLDFFPKINFPMEFCVYLSGTMDLYGYSADKLDKSFALMEHNGAPYIYWLTKPDNTAEDGESFQVSIAQGNMPSQDLLFLGEDNTTMVAFKRVVENL